MPIKGAEILLELLNAAPILKYLEIERVDDDSEDYDSLGSFSILCFTSLGRSHVNYIEGLSTDYCIEKFFLKRGAQLKNLFIWVQEGQVTTNEIIEKLSMFPKASSDVKIMRIPTLSNYA